MAKTRYGLEDWKVKTKKKHPGFEIDQIDPPIIVPPVQLWPGTAMEQAQTNPYRAAIAILGQDEYDRFEAAGGTPGIFFAMVEDNEEATVGESKASSGSSTSTARPSSTTV